MASNSATETPLEYTTGSWHHTFFDVKHTPEQGKAIAQQAQALAREFADDTAALEITPTQVAQADSWYASAEGQECLSALLSKAWQSMAAKSAYAMPAHDARHAVYKVPAAALLHMQAEAAQGYERVGILGALLHDYGRWAEEHVFGCPNEGVVHARFSFLLTRELLQAYDMPVFVRNQLLLAVLGHTTGANPEDPMPLKLTVSADRDQLYGPELVLRLTHHGIEDTWVQSSFYGEKPGTPILNRLHHFHNNRLPGPLFARERETVALQRTVRTFLLLGEDADTSAARWRGAVAQSAKAAPRTFFPEHWEAAWEAAQAEPQARSPSPSPRAAVAQILSAPNVAPNPRHLEIALRKVSDVPESHVPRLTRALDWIHEQRIARDQEERAALLSLQSAYANDKVVLALCAFLLAPSAY